MHAAGRAGSGGAADTYKGLPRRIRQASLAPQLRNSPVPDADAVGRADASAPRSPEHIRAVMASLQEGWQRGRADGTASAAGDATGGTEDRATDDTAGQATVGTVDQTAGSDTDAAGGDL